MSGVCSPGWKEAAGSIHIGTVFVAESFEHHLFFPNLRFACAAPRLFRAHFLPGPGGVSYHSNMGHFAI
jgi:hypothetical protein